MPKDPLPKDIHTGFAPIKRVGGAHLVGARTGPYFELHGCDSSELLHFISKVVGYGDMCSITSTSDGGACALIIIHDGKPWLKGYFRNEEQMLTLIDNLLEVGYGD